LSEEFGGALPTAIWAEQQQLPAGFLEEIVFFRGYANAKQAYDQACAQGGDAVQRLPASRLMTLVRTVDFELVTEERAQQTDG
jgi:hypothetical protein